MHLLVLDESHSRPSDRAPYFLVGGMVADQEALAALHDDIERIRGHFGFRVGDPLKWATSNRPRHIDARTHMQAKQAVIDACARRSMGLTACIARQVDVRADAGWTDVERAEVCSRSVFSTFLEYLAERRADGVCFIDWLGPDGRRLLPILFQQSERARSGTPGAPRVLAAAATCDGASHLSSVTDILIGGLAYAVNAPTDPKFMDVVRGFLPSIARLLLSRTDDDGRRSVAGRAITYLTDTGRGDAPIPAGAFLQATERLADAIETAERP